MSDFLLDLREPEIRQKETRKAASMLRFCADSQVRVLQCQAFSLLISRVDGFELWGPYEWESDKGKGMAALSGRIAMDQPEWEAVRRVEGPGGLACKAIFNLYRKGGAD